jgi:L-galactose dehydrogenase
MMWSPFSKQHSIGLIHGTGLHTGILTQEGAPAWHPAPPAVHQAARKAADLCRERGADIAEIRFCLNHPYVSSTLVGIASETQMKGHLKLLRVKTDPVLVEEDSLGRGAGVQLCSAVGQAGEPWARGEKIMLT